MAQSITVIWHRIIYHSKS